MIETPTLEKGSKTGVYGLVKKTEKNKNKGGGKVSLTFNLAGV